jgi:hypothetical protein
MDKQDNNESLPNPSISNFFTQNQASSTNCNTNTNTNTNIVPSVPSLSPSYQAFPPIDNNNNQVQQPIIQSSNYNQNNTQQVQAIPQTQKTFLEKVNSTASGVLDFLKSKAPPIPSNIITKKLLDNVDPLTILTDIKMESFEENIIKKSTKEVECLKLEKTQLNDQTIIVNISNPHQINNSLFSTSYILYDVSTIQFKWMVNRRYSDFIWLRDCLKNLFPADILPILPKKKIGNRRFEKDFLQKREKGLQKFINEIVNNEKYKATEILTIFLSCGERNLFEQKMKIISPKLLYNQNIYNIKSLDGKKKILNLDNFETEKDIFQNFNSISIYSNMQNNLLNELQNNLSGYKKSMAASCNYLEEAEKNFLKLSMIMDKVNISDKIKNVYEQYEIFFKNWKRIQANQCCIIKDFIKNFFKKIINKFEPLIENLEKQQSLIEEYQTIKNKIMAKKELLWQQMDVSKWELNQTEQIDTSRLYRDKIYAQEKMCFKESLEINMKGELLGYYFYQNYESFKNLIEELNKSYIINIKDFANQIYPSLTDGINVYSNLVSHSF